MSHHSLSVETVVICAQKSKGKDDQQIMKKRIPLLSILLMSLLLFSVAACGGGGQTTTPTTTTSGGATTTQPSAPTNVIDRVVEASVAAEGANFADHIDIINDASQVTMISPMLPAGSGHPQALISRMIYDRLIYESFPGVFEPELATRWETDFKTFTFYLRNDVYYHNGDHFTAEDFVWFIGLVQENPGVPAWRTWSTVESARAIEPYVLEIVLNEMDTDYLFTLAGHAATALNRRAYEENPDDPSWAWVGTGPYKIIGLEPNNYVALERNDNFWGEAPPTKTVTWWSIPEMATRTVMLQNGQAQLCFAVTPEDLDMLDDHPDYQIFPVRLNPPIVIGFNNHGDEIMMCPNFRRAVAHAIKVDDIATVAYGRWQEPAWDGNFWGPDTQYRREGLPKWEHNPDLAREYLAKSVYDGRPIQMATSFVHNIRASELVQLQLADVGIDIDILVTDATGFTEMHVWNPDSDRQMHLFAIGMSPTASGALRSAFTPGFTSNRLNYDNPYVVELARELSVTIDENRRRDIVHEVQDIFYEEVPAIVIYWRINGYPAVNGIGGIKFSSDSFAFNLRNVYWDLNETPANLRP